MTIKVALIDESPIFRLGLKKCLADENIEVIGEAADGVSGQRLIRQKQPDIVLLSADLPDGAALTFCDFAAAHFPKMRLIFLLNPHDLNLLNRLMDTAAQGFLAKNSAYSVPEAIKTVSSGSTYLQPEMGLLLIRFREKDSSSAIHSLTDREYQVLTLIARGKTSEAIAAMIHISLKTVFNLKSSGFKKLGIHTVEQLRDRILK